MDKYGDEEDLFIGIARKDIDLNVRPLDSGMFWGYMCLWNILIDRLEKYWLIRSNSSKKVGADGVLYDYGYQAKQNDIIGVLLEFKSGMGSLSFYRNGVITYIIMFRRKR